MNECSTLFFIVHVFRPFKVLHRPGLRQSTAVRAPVWLFLRFGLWLVLGQSVSGLAFPSFDVRLQRAQSSLFHTGSAFNVCLCGQMKDQLPPPSLSYPLTLTHQQSHSHSSSAATGTRCFLICAQLGHVWHTHG